MEPVPTQVAEAVEPVEEAIVADEVAAAEFTGIEEAPMEQAEVRFQQHAAKRKRKQESAQESEPSG